MNQCDFSSVTEVTGYKVTSEQIERMCTRYRFASEFCKDKEVLEIACGSGQGLGYLSKKAKKVVGGDIDKNLLDKGSIHYKNRDKISLKQMDAHELPFEDNNFDVVIVFEAIYYLAQPEKFIKEAKRVLKKNGAILICTANKDWEDFNPSPFSYKYFSAPELFDLLEKEGFKKIYLYGDSLVNSETMKDKIISFIKKTAVKLHLIPNTMRGKEFLKRIFCGELLPLPPEIDDGLFAYNAPKQISSDRPNSDYKVLFSVAYK